MQLRKIRICDFGKCADVTVDPSHSLAVIVTENWVTKNSLLHPRRLVVDPGLRDNRSSMRRLPRDFPVSQTVLGRALAAMCAAGDDGLGRGGPMPNGSRRMVSGK